MPQPKSSSGRSRKTNSKSAARNDENVTKGITALREALARAVMLPTERLREVLDDAVRRGRMTRSDAEELVQSLISMGRRQTEDMLADLEQAVGRQRSGADRVVSHARRAAGLGNTFPIDNYDDLAAAEITSRLDDLTPTELRQIRDYERKHGNRKTVLSAVERKLG